MNRKTLLLVFILGALYATPALADGPGSMGYQLLTAVSGAAETFVVNLYGKLSIAFEPIFEVLMTIYIFWIGVRLLKGQGGFDFVTAMIQLAYITFIVQLVIYPTVFINWFYKPVMDAVYALPSYIIKTGSALGDSAGEGNSLSHMFTAIEKIVGKMLAVGDKMADQSGLWTQTTRKVSFMLGGWLLKLVYFALLIVFTTMYTLGIISANIILATAPFAIGLWIFPASRSFSQNCLRAFLNYCLVPQFAAVAMAMSLSFMGDMASEADIAIAGDMAEEVSEWFLYKALLYGLFAIFFHLKASDFAAQVSGGGASGFGGIFATGLSLGASAFHTSTSVSTSAARKAALSLSDMGARIYQKRKLG